MSFFRLSGAVLPTLVPLGSEKIHFTTTQRAICLRELLLHEQYHS
jgi:hypothetical protein